MESGYNDIIQSNTEFLAEINRSKHEEFTKILVKYLNKLKGMFNFDTILTLQPLILDRRLESFVSNFENDYSAISIIREMDAPTRAGILNSVNELTEFGALKNTAFPFFDPAIFSQVIVHPIMNAYNFSFGNGGIFFLNKNTYFELTPYMKRAIASVSETIALAYNNYRKSQMYNTSYSIFQIMQASSKTAVCVYKHHGIIIFANKYFYELIDKSEEETFGENIMDVMKMKNHNSIGDLHTLSFIPNLKLVKDDEAMYGELIKQNGETVFIRKYYRPIELENQWYKMLLLEDITQELANIDSIELSSFYDVLTGLKNRNYFQKDINSLFLKNKLPVATIVGDINGLKLMNDIFGHDYGDFMIKSIADILKSNCNNGDVYRFSGDEFYVFLNNTDEDSVRNTIERINDDCKKEFEKLNFIGISLGYNMVYDPATKVENSIRKAEAEMYYVKSLSSESIKNESISSLKKIYLERFSSEKERTDRMVSIARELSSYLDLRESEVEDICTALELIDIGKVSINHFLLSDKIMKNDDEFENMKKHCRIGYKIASLTYETSHLARLILNHHENWDGSGFPQGIKGNSIPFLSRVIRIIEYYDSISSKNRELGIEDAINELEIRKGRLFDPAITDSFIRYITENRTANL